ncbi:YhgE/Pip family protein [Streptomyces chryseus]|uniref:Membrane protein n=1 Tax=Streptomyces chryseus TaxID=68186 RepID=A0ABQ3DEY1_9ACTN|nr:YhgE/Pip domain-containing protein [Streptomyces chryseus]GGW92761.1 membrane protein [Streptomyces chryseus]GHA84452.1 membrane protein [Streptomyces chryseus]
MRSPKLAALELKRFGRGKLPRAALVALLLLPLLYGALYLWSFWDPYGRLDRIPVALVNDDRGAEAGGKKIAAGDEITEKLLDSKVFEWHEVSADEARRGVEDGAYYLSLTMPENFSERIASSSGDVPETSALRVRTNDANNYIVGQISRTVFSEVRTAASKDASRSFLDKIFISFSDIHDSTEKAAKGADDIRGGIGKAKKGSSDLKGGLNKAKAGSAELSQGLTKAKKASTKLSGGLRTLHTKSGELKTGAQGVADGTQRLADKVNGIANSVSPYLRDNGKTVGDTAKLVADSTRIVRDNLGSLVKRAPVAAEASRVAADELHTVYAARCVNQPLADPACPHLKKADKAAADTALIAADVNNLVKNQRGDLDQLDKELGKLQDQARKIAERAPHLDEDLDTAVSQVNALNNGAKKVAEGAARISTGLGSAKTGAVDLDSGIGRLDTGATDLDNGLARLQSGAGELNGGLIKLVDGSGDLASGLHKGVGKIPDYDKEKRDQRTGVMADPVQLASQSMHKAPNYGTGFAPYFIPLSLWVGAMVAYMLIQPLNRRALAAGASAWRIALAGWLPVAALGVLQVAALMSVLHWGLGLRMERAAGTIGFLVLVTGCFSAIVQWLNARFGAAGRILVLAVLMLQLTSAGGTYPVQTSPGFFNAIHPFLPMTYVVEGLRRLITGGGLEPVWTGSVVLLAFTAGAVALTALSARRKQVWTLDRLHPELSL